MERGCRTRLGCGRRGRDGWNAGAGGAAGGWRMPEGGRDADAEGATTGVRTPKRGRDTEARPPCRYRRAAGARGSLE